MHLAVVDEQVVAGLDVTGQPGVCRADLVSVAGHVARRDGERRPGGQGHRTVGKRAGADLGTLQVGQHGHRASHVVAGPADQPVALVVVGVRAV